MLSIGARHGTDAWSSSSCQSSFVIDGDACESRLAFREEQAIALHTNVHYVHGTRAIYVQLVIDNSADQLSPEKK